MNKKVREIEREKVDRARRKREIQKEQKDKERTCEINE